MELKATNNSRETYLGVILTYATTFVSLCASLVLTPIIIRLLGQSEYGLYETMGSFVAYLAVLDLGFGAVVTRYTAKYQNEGDYQSRDKFLYTCRNVYAILCSIIVVLGFVLYNLIDKAFGNTFTPEELEKAHYVFIIVLGTTVVSIFSQVYKGCLNGIEKFVLPKVVLLFKVILTKIVAITILFLGGDSIGYTLVLFTFELLSCIVLMIQSHRNVSFVRNKMPWPQLKEIFIFTSYLFILALVSQLYWQIDKLLLGMLIGTTTVAIYSAAMNIQNIVRNVSSSLKEILIPKASRISLEDKDAPSRLTGFMIKSGRIILIVYGLLLSGITILGDKFLYLWLGEDYVGGYPILLVLGWSALLPSVLIPGEEVCKTYNRHGPLTMLYLGISLLNVVLTFFSVKLFGMMGAAASTAFGILLGNVYVAVIYYHKTFNILVSDLFKGLFKGTIFTIAVTIAFGFAVQKVLPVMSWGVLLLEVGIITFVYVGASWLIGLNQDEKQMILRFRERIRH